jgi:polyphosphate kinase 2 (PPK2 family)
MNPLGTRATSFRVPTKEELSHDFLWRIHQETPAHGTVQIFNRSHYEDILVPTVEKLIDKKIINKRYDQINNFEDTLQEN